MDANEHGLKHGEITKKIIGVFYDVYNDLGYGFLESVYQRSLGLALEAAGLAVCNRVEIPMVSRNAGWLLRG
jgi:GxxExxY protein